MNKASGSISRFNDYLYRACRRERWRHILTFAGITVFALCGLTLAGAWLGLYRGFTPVLDLSIRTLILLTAALAIAWLLWRPLKTLAADKGSQLVESSDAAFNGRVNTFLDTRDSNPDQPFLGLLARDALGVARRVPMQRIVPTSALVWPVLLLIALLGATASFVQLAPASWKNAALHVWWGWQDTTLVEQRRIDVQPGTIELLAGEDLELDITLLGFTQQLATLHVRGPDDSDWQSSEISVSPDGGFGFQLFRVSEGFDYYVESGFTQSDEFTVSVLQPARLQSIDVQYEYPEWTRLPTASIEDVTNISAVKDSQITLTFHLDKALNDGLLLLGGEALSMDEQLTDDGATYQARFALQNDTEYQLMDTMLDRQIPISGAHAVIVRGDEAPEVQFLSPGRDVTASPIEEVSISVEAKDDFGIESIELMYSVNAGDWQSIQLDNAELASHVFYLESMGTDDLIEPELLSRIRQRCSA